PDAVEDHADGPDQLEAAVPVAPLVEQGQREGESEDRGQRGKDDRQVHRRAALASWKVAIRRSRSRSSSPEAASYSAASRAASSARRRPKPVSSSRKGLRAA